LGLFIKLTSKGPIFFTQHRTGLNNKEFYIIKFRTMRLNAEADTMTARKEDPRRTKVGRFLRKTNIDEIPQFINVFLGNMSIIGPRPHMLSETVHYSKIIDSYLVRHFIKPGLTGWAQINGFHGNSVNPTIMRARVKYDVYYIENWSVALDIKIFFITIYDMFRKLYIPYSIKNYNIKRFTVQI
jgi:lipopolysaccharide/colanic/teichoic acid biosynthesis glycosyltransferase